MFRKVRKARLQEIQQDFNTTDFIKICDNANFFGQKSKKMSQIRGNGVLALTSDYLIFYMWYPKRKLSIPVNKIQSVEISKGFLGKIRSGYPVLKIIFFNEHGFEDEAGWIVSDQNHWLTLLS